MADGELLVAGGQSQTTQCPPCLNPGASANGGTEVPLIHLNHTDPGLFME